MYQDILVVMVIWDRACKQNATCAAALTLHVHMCNAHCAVALTLDVQMCNADFAVALTLHVQTKCYNLQLPRPYMCKCEMHIV